MFTQINPTLLCGSDVECICSRNVYSDKSYSCWCYLNFVSVIFDAKLCESVLFLLCLSSIMLSTDRYLPTLYRCLRERLYQTCFTSVLLSMNLATTFHYQMVVNITTVVPSVHQ